MASGYAAEANGVGSTAYGSGSQAYDYDTAIGYNAVVNADNSAALGANLEVNSTNSVALGSDTRIGNNSDGSVALGQGATVGTGSEGSMALGQGAVVEDGVTGSVALGQDSVASESNTISVGSDTIKRRITNVADGIDPYDAVNKRQLDEVAGRINSVGALSSALSGMHPNARSDSDTQVSLGVGYYEGESAVAVGAFHYIRDDALINLGVSHSSVGGTMYRGGVTWGF